VYRGFTTIENSCEKAWVDFFNGQNNTYTDALDRALDEGLVLIGDLIHLEILQGFRSDSDFKAAK